MFKLESVNIGCTPPDKLCTLRRHTLVIFLLHIGLERHRVILKHSGHFNSVSLWLLITEKEECWHHKNFCPFMTETRHFRKILSYLTMWVHWSCHPWTPDIWHNCSRWCADESDPGSLLFPKPAATVRRPGRNCSAGQSAGSSCTIFQHLPIIGKEA